MNTRGVGFFPLRFSVFLFSLFALCCFCAVLFVSERCKPFRTHLPSFFISTCSYQQQQNNNNNNNSIDVYLRPYPVAKLHPPFTDDEVSPPASLARLSSLSAAPATGAEATQRVREWLRCGALFEMWQEPTDAGYLCVCVFLIFRCWVLLFIFQPLSFCDDYVFLYLYSILLYVVVLLTGCLSFCNTHSCTHGLAIDLPLVERHMDGGDNVIDAHTRMPGALLSALYARIDPEAATQQTAAGGRSGGGCELM